MTYSIPSMRAAPTRPRGVLQILKAYFSTNRVGDLLLLEGKITESQLQQALVRAKTDRRRIGEILVEAGYLRRHQLYATLGKQWGVRSLAWSVALVMSIGAFTPRQARADDTHLAYAATETLQNQSALRFVDDLKGFGKRKLYPALFGSDEKWSNDLSAFTKWTSMFNRYEAQIQSPAATALLTSWSAGMDTYRNDDLGQLARDVDTWINQAEYIEDRVNYGRSDYWATPVEFFRNGGDCEDFAIAKYATLKAMGVPENRLRISIVQDLVKNIPHAILVVYADEGPLVLDNQSKETRRADQISRYKPIFSINRMAWWLHTPAADVQVATAAQ